MSFLSRSWIEKDESNAYKTLKIKADRGRKWAESSCPCTSSKRIEISNYRSKSRRSVDPKDLI